jgi:hypothetical protein
MTEVLSSSGARLVLAKCLRGDIQLIGRRVHALKMPGLVDYSMHGLLEWTGEESGEGKEEEKERSASRKEMSVAYRN